MLKPIVKPMDRFTALDNSVDVMSSIDCRGWGVQWTDNGGRCGICGDPWSDFPREHEAPLGKYATGEDKLKQKTTSFKVLCVSP